MPLYTASSPPIMTSAHASSSRVVHRTTGVGQSLADLYNSRHAQESAGPSSRNSGSSSSLADLYNQRHDNETRKEQASSSSLADLYNKRHDEEGRKEKQPSSTSLADLYNRRYEDELQFNEEDDDVQEVAPRVQHRVRTGPSATVQTKRPQRPASLEISDDETPEPQSLLPSDIDELEEEQGEEQDDVDVDSTPLRDSQDQSQARSVSVAALSDRPEVVYVHRQSIPRRGALGASATRLTRESDDEADLQATPEPELPSGSASSLSALARPHASPSKLIIHSTSDSLGSESGTSTPPIAPHHRKAKGVSQALLGSTQEEESMNSLLRYDSTQQESAGGQQSDRVRTGSSDDVVFISDSSFDERPRSATPPQQRYRSPRLQPSSARSGSEPWPSTEGDVAITLPPAAQQMRERSAEQTDSHSASELQSSPESHQIPPLGGGLQSELERGAVSDADSDTPIITDARINDVRAVESSAGATTRDASDSDAQRIRYPRRARNVTDYNVKRAFERYEQDQNLDAHPAASVAVTIAPVDKRKKTPLPEETAPQEFFDALRTPGINKAANALTPHASFRDFLVAKARTDSAVAAASASAAPSTRSHDSHGILTEAEAQTIPRLHFGPTSLLNITVNAEDRGSLYQLKPSTRRWLGISGPGPLQLTEDDAEDKFVTPPRLGDRTPLNLTLKDLIPSHLDEERNTASSLRRAFGLHEGDGAGLIGRSRTSEALESAARHLRLGRAYKQPLPDTLRTFADMEHAESIRLEEYIADIQRLAVEAKAREQGQILVEVQNNEWIHTQFDSVGRKRFAKVRPFTGGEMRIYYDLKQSSPVLPEDDSQGYEVVKIVSPRKSPFGSRLASAPPIRGDSDAEEEENVFQSGSFQDADDRDAGRSSAFLQLNDPLARQETLPPQPRGIVPRKEAQPAMARSVGPQLAPKKFIEPQAAAKKPHCQPPPPDQKAAEPQPAPLKFKPAAAISTASSTSSNLRHAAPKPAPSKPKAPAAKGQRNLHSFFSTQPSPSQPLPKPPSKTASAPVSKPLTKSAPTPASATPKGKNKALGSDFKVWSSPSCTPDPEVQVIVDLTRSSSASESLAAGPVPTSSNSSSGDGKRRRDRSVSPTVAGSSSSKKRKEVVNGEPEKTKKTVGLGDGRVDAFIKAEARRREVLRRRAEEAQAQAKEEKRASASSRPKQNTRKSDVSSIVAVELPARPRDGATSAKRKRIGPKSVSSRHWEQEASCSSEASKQTVHVQLPPPPMFASPSPPKKARASSSSAVGGRQGGDGVSIQLPNATPSPSRGGWAGITGWYTNTRDTFSPTPADDQPRPKSKSGDKVKRKKDKGDKGKDREKQRGTRSDRERAKDNRQAKNLLLVLSQRRRK
ncbi:uncharacterized protein UTRI_00519_B [Ustilago trichophora]|uniref:Uncharacterized protein n=1 Tax=Ustilago trichophora TaxID=86804 RepID=A0A5C3DPY2_9BASI|nr:uncharacterized protein UTRI_00519_B [Ustilago trichophora]